MSNQTSKPLLEALEVRDGERSAWTGNEGDTLDTQHRRGVDGCRLRGGGGVRSDLVVSEIVEKVGSRIRLNGRIERLDDGVHTGLERSYRKDRGCFESCDSVLFRNFALPLQVALHSRRHDELLVGDGDVSGSQLYGHGLNVSGVPHG